jgi:anti-sigma B factor antagonist
MFNIKVQNGNEVFLIGRFDASQAEKVGNALDSITDNCKVDFSELDYISSAGLGILIKNYSRLKDLGKSIRLVNMNKHVKEVFRYSKLDEVFQIE